MKLHKDSHVDHGLSQAILDWLLAHFADRTEFTLETVELPADLGTVPCGLHGPIMGDEPVGDAEVVLERRGDRSWTSRLCDRPVRQVRTVSVIAGPYDGQPCVLYTTYGGPVAPQEPGDPDCKDQDASREFWSTHALSLSR
jgi:hypothetical protein